MSDRGIECTDCVEKGHYVEKVKEVIHLPIVPPKAQPKVEPKETKTETPDLNYDEIMKMFKKQEEEKKQTWERLKEKGIDIEQLQRNLNKGKMNSDLKKPSPKKEEEETVEKKEL